MTDKLQNDLLIRACRRQKTERTPVWIMRQAGRYLPQYQAVRARADFMTMCRTPELAAEVTLQPVDIIGVDAAIIFSDILVIPDAMGMPLQFHEGSGPVFEQPLRSRADFDALRAIDAAADLGYVMDALRLARKELAGRVPLIGFAGAPWTLAAYMVEGHGSKNFAEVKKLMYGSPELLTGLLERLAVAVADYLTAQVAAGAQALQLFDSWAGILTPECFRRFSLPYLRQVVSKVKSTGVPIIVFARDAGHSFRELADIGADVLSVSWREDLAVARQQVDGKVGLQGNVDPCALFSSTDVIRREVVDCLRVFGGEPGHVFNLGHGILPETPVAHARAFVQAVKDESARIRSGE